MITGTLLTIFYFIALSTTTGVGVEANALASSLSDLPFDENDHLSTHVLAVPAGKCASLLKDAADFGDGSFGHQWVELEGEAFKSVFGHLKAFSDFPEDDEVTDFNKDCLAVCLEKGTLREVVARPLPHRYFIQGEVDQDGDGDRVDKMTLQAFFMSDSCARVSANSYVIMSFCGCCELTGACSFFIRLNMALSTTITIQLKCTGLTTQGKRGSIKR
jgi:hypothetical protein